MHTKQVLTTLCHAWLERYWTHGPFGTKVRGVAGCKCGTRFFSTWWHNFLVLILHCLIPWLNSRDTFLMTTLLLNHLKYRVSHFLSIRAKSKCDQDPDHILIGPGLTESITLFLGQPIYCEAQRQTTNQVCEDCRAKPKIKKRGY